MINPNDIIRWDRDTIEERGNYLIWHQEAPVESLEQEVEDYRVMWDYAVILGVDPEHIKEVWRERIRQQALAEMAAKPYGHLRIKRLCREAGVKL